MDAYRALPEGWAPAPPDIWTDLHMWRKLLAMDKLTFATRAAVTALKFAAPARRDMPLEQRAQEIRGYLERIRDPRQREEIVQAAWRSLLAAKQAEIDSMVRSRSWRLTAPLRAFTARTGW